jgi:hypothetical protein
MATRLGPVLRLRDCDQAAKLWRVSALLVTDESDGEPTLSTNNAADIIVTRTNFATEAGLKFWRFDLDVKMGDQARTVAYEVDGQKWSFAVPRKGSQPNFAYVSCNGFSSLKLMKAVRDKNALWSDMMKCHLAGSFHVLLMGGDQVYADAMWEMVKPLRAWNQLSWDDKKAKFKDPSSALQTGLREHFFKIMYCERWSQPEVRAAMAQIPTIMMWDDHDIMDGWGSYDDEQLGCPVYQFIFATARRCFELFQLQGTTSDPVFIKATPNTYSQIYNFGAVAPLVPDLRSERRLDQVISPPSWDAIYTALGAIKGPANGGSCHQLMVMSSIPVMHARFSQVETILGWVPGEQELEDDLHDHWSSRPHRAERLRLINRLFKVAQDQKTRVTIVSGDVHVAAHASIVFERKGADSYADALVQLTSSAVVHPAPPAIMQFALNHLFEEDEEIDPSIVGHMEKMPGEERRYIAARNWLSLEPDNRGNSQNRIWANWHVEDDLEHPYTRVIHPIT